MNNKITFNKSILLNNDKCCHNTWKNDYEAVENKIEGIMSRSIMVTNASHTQNKTNGIVSSKIITVVYIYGKRNVHYLSSTNRK